MDVEAKVKGTIGDLVVNNLILNARIEELLQQLQAKDQKIAELEADRRPHLVEKGA